MAKKNFYIRSALFVPAANIERIPKALATDASIVIVDLEDAVEADAKFSVRHQLEKWANDNPGRRFFLRINDAQSPWFIDDLAFVGDCIFKNSIVRTDLPGGSMETMKKSLQFFKELKRDFTLLPGHGERTRLSYEKMMNPFLNGQY